MSESSHPLTKRMAILGGTAYIVAIVQYAIAQLVAAAAWNPPYNWMTNFISDLGNTACGQFAIHGSSSYVCSPRHAVMNASFVVGGVLLIVGTVLLWHLWPARRMTTVALWLWLVAGVGKIVVGLVPENTNASLHVAGATNLLIGSVAILLLSLVARRQHRPLATTGLIIGVVGLVGGVLSTAAQGAGSALDLGIGAGGMERVAGYPSNIWLVIVGVIAILSTKEQTTPAARRPIRADGLGTVGL